MNRNKAVFWLLTLTLLVAGPGVSGPAWCEFNPPEDLEIERTWSMMAYGESIGVIRGITSVDTAEGKVLVKQKFSGMVGVRPGVSLRSVETVWIGPDGMEAFEGVFQETGSPDKTTMKAGLDGETLTFDLVMKQGDPAYSEGFVKDLDYHWSTAYMDVGRQGFEKDKPFEKKILDIYSLQSKVVKGTYLGDETVEQGGHRLECRKIRFDYGDIKGTMWLARDALSWFLVKEEAEADGVPFQMYLDEYTHKEKKAAAGKEGGKKGFGF